MTTKRKPKAIIVTGCRRWTDEDHIVSVLDGIDKPDGMGIGAVRVVIHGDAEGADEIADWWANDRALAMPAQWDEHGLAAGPKRNEEMLTVLLALGRCGHDIAVYAFPMPGSKGTYHMMRIAREAGVPVHDHGLDHKVVIP